MGKALYRKYRSTSLDEVVGQSHITQLLKRAIEQDRVGHAYLLTGPRGVGKTSIARILAHEINKLPYSDEHTHLDIIEIDAASNNGVEDIRDLREKVRLAPTSAEKKVYIIDEVHMLSKAAFNALLKTLEEPPIHVVFILATTDADKLPATIISRTQQFTFRAISVPDAVRHLRTIAEAEKITIDDKALELIAKRGNGSFRDSISLLDQLASLSDKKSGITHDLIEQTLGMASSDITERLIAGYSTSDLSLIVKTLDESEHNGTAATMLALQLIDSVRQQVASKPELLPLLDGLLEVQRATQPHIKLLTVLGAHAVPKPKRAALAVESPVVLTPLEVQATKPHPKESAVAPPVAQRSLKPKQIEVVPDSDGTADLSSFIWDDLVSHVQKNHIALYSVMSKCSHETDGGTLRIFTMNAFYKKKLDTAKYRSILAESLDSLGFPDTGIDTVPSTTPIKDTQAAKVAAIMGGGEAVTIEDSDGK